MVDVAAVVKSIVRDHIVRVEIETDDGYRSWSEPMSNISVGVYASKNAKYGSWVSDVDCDMSCWCTATWRDGFPAAM